MLIPPVVDVYRGPDVGLSIHFVDDLVSARPPNGSATHEIMTPIKRSLSQYVGFGVKKNLELGDSQYCRTTVSCWHQYCEGPRTHLLAAAKIVNTTCATATCSVGARSRRVTH